ncbi:hypothetical protein MLD38_037048 [Melastoma candidum]|uniref:Uncharacterized protein n=1 Tax=Melastoma candidum TaxID=119954 RepID=A0ACB9LLF7_9MYRT|nr:hypothetical protein MLD38_037048 [Melastoma candidum]
MVLGQFLLGCAGIVLVLHVSWDMSAGEFNEDRSPHDEVTVDKSNAMSSILISIDVNNERGCNLVATPGLAVIHVNDQVDLSV